MTVQGNAEANARAPLIREVSQYDVDFVIPRLGVDIPVGIDPFLLYKSRDPALRELHGTLVGAFNAGIDAVRRGDLAVAERRFDFPEVAEIGFGYTKGGKGGSGVGAILKGLILDTLANAPALLERGVRHVEEMQLLSAGIGPDRISDISANLLKRFLIEYTQRQCAIWGIELTRGVPVEHVFAPESGEWEDGHYDLPISAKDGRAILLVPRRVVRVLPWINYDDFLRGEFSAYLRARRDASAAESRTKKASKPAVVSVTRADISLVERYVRSREQAAADAHPAASYGDDLDRTVCAQAGVLADRLRATPTGREAAAAYQRLVLEILNFVFNPDLVDGQPEVRTIDGTERRDIIFTNESDDSFWSYLRSEHSGLLVMFEVKNTDDLRPDALNQTATYLGDRLGRLGVIVTRQPAPEAIQRKAMSVWNDSGTARKAILILSDSDLHELLDLRCRDRSPTKWMQRRYRDFRMALQ